MKHARPPSSTSAARRALLLALVLFLAMTTVGPAQPQTGQMMLSSQPGAQVYWESVLIGEVGADGTLMIRAIPVGAYSLLLTKEGFRDLVVRLTIEPGDNRLEANLERIAEPAPPLRETAQALEPAPVAEPNASASGPSPGPREEEIEEKDRDVREGESNPESRAAESTSSAISPDADTPIAKPEPQPAEQPLASQPPPPAEPEPLPKTATEPEGEAATPSAGRSEEAELDGAASGPPPSSPRSFRWLAFLPLVVVATWGAYLLHRQLNRRRAMVEQTPPSGPQLSAKASSRRSRPLGFIDDLKQRERLLELQGRPSRPMKVVASASSPQTSTVGDPRQNDED